MLMRAANARRPAVIGATITVEWGYEEHSIRLSPEDWAAVKSGKPLSLDGDGYDYEGEFFEDTWTFEGGLSGALVVTYGDDGAVGFDGVLEDATISEEPIAPRGKKRRQQA
jgi:hypothetical protein